MSYTFHLYNIYLDDSGYPHDGRADKNPYLHDRHADKDSYPHDSNNQCIRPKIKFYLFVIAYLPTLLLPTQPFFSVFPEVFFLFFFFCCFDISVSV